MIEKTLMNCKPTEFVAQTCKIKRSVSRFLKDTDLLAIRRRMPEDLKKVDKNAGAEERLEAVRHNSEAMSRQNRQNLSDILDAMLEKHPEETLEVMALCCFVEPKDVDSHPMRDYLMAFNDLLNDEAVLGFFTSLASLGQTAGLTESRK